MSNFTWITELFVNSAWTPISGDVRYSVGFDTTRGRGNERGKVVPTNMTLSLLNNDTPPKYSPRVPTSTYYGQIGRNTPLRVYRGQKHLGDDNSSTTSTTSHVAPAIVAEDDGLMVSAWLSEGPINYTVPGDMTGGTERDSTFTTMQSAHKTITSGSTGTKTATASLSATYVALSAVAHGTSVTVQENLSNAALSTDITLSTGSGTTKGWWLLAIHGWDYDVDDNMPTAPDCNRSGGWIPIADTGVIIPNASFALHARAWLKRVKVGGVHKVKFRSNTASGAPVDNQARLYVLSNVDNWQIRMHGEVPSWPAQADTTENDIRVDLNVAGILRRYEQGSAPLRSALTRALPTAGIMDPSAYWPLEDGAGSTRAASGLVDGAAMTIHTGTIDWGAFTNIAAGSAPVPNWRTSTGTLIANVKNVDGTWGVGFTIDYTSTDNWSAVWIDLNGGPYSQIRIAFSNQIICTGITSSGTTDFITQATNLSDGKTHWVELDTGADQYVLTVDGVELQTSAVITAASNATMNAIRGRNRSAGDDCGLGHLTIWNTNDAASHWAYINEAINGYDGETAGRRIQRLCIEEDIFFECVGDTDLTSKMGPQRIAALVDLWRDAEDVDNGVLYEPRQQLGLAYRTRESIYNLTAVAELTYNAQAEVMPPLKLDPDDLRTRNDVSATRIGGSSARYVKRTGSLSIEEPPAGAGKGYDDTVSLNAHTDNDLLDHAAWRVHLGTQDVERYPLVPLHLTKMQEAAKTALMDDVAALDIYDRFTIDSMPAWVAPEDASQLVEGYHENFDQFMWTIDFNGSPEVGYQIGTLETGTRARLDTAGCELFEDLTTTETAADVATTEGPPWTTVGAQFPFNIRIRSATAPPPGEICTVTDCDDYTWSFINVGAVAHANNANTTPGLPASRAAGDLLLTFAAIRNSGTGSPDTATDATKIWSYGNMAIFARKATNTALDQPTVSYIGGIANADTSAQTACFRSTLGTFNDVNKLLVMKRQLRTVTPAQDIAYPALRLPSHFPNCIILYLGWKQDDWTSVASPGTEIAEPDTTTGDDQGIVWAYTIQTTAAFISAGSFTVTGGATAASRGAVLAIRSDVQAMTLTRSVNGVVKAHSTGDSLSLATPLVLAK